MGMLEHITPTVVTPHRREYLWGGQLHIIFARFNQTANGLSCWLEVRWIGQVPEPQLLAAARFDLMSSRTVPSVVKLVEGVLGKGDLPTAQILTAICYDVVRDHLEGAPTIRLSDHKAAATSWLLKPIVGGTGSSSFVGPGGSGKSFFALATMATLATGRTGFLGIKPHKTGPVMHLDWESDADTQTKRLEAVCQPLGIPIPTNILYRPQEGPLWNRTEEIATACARDGVILVVVDSVMLARGGDAFGPEGTIQLYSALRQIGVPALLIDHKSREAIRKGWKGSYGSVINDNSTRLMWEFEPAEDLPDVTTHAFKMSQSKRNNDRKRRDMAFEWTVTNDDRDELESVRFTPIDPFNVVTLHAAEDSPLADRILVALARAGNLGMTVAEISEAVGSKPDQVRNRLNQKLQGRVFKRVDRWFVKGMDDQAAAGGWEPDAAPY